MDVCAGALHRAAEVGIAVGLAFLLAVSQATAMLVPDTGTSQLPARCVF
jgi:hypothetical protein